MQLEVGQVYRRRDPERELTVIVLDVRDEKHPKGLGEGYGDSGCAWPIDLTADAIDPDGLHPFDVHILCGAQKAHGDEVWEFVAGVRYVLRADGRFHSTREETS